MKHYNCNETRDANSCYFCIIFVLSEQIAHFMHN